MIKDLEKVIKTKVWYRKMCNATETGRKSHDNKENWIVG